jgi:hypothetical protein
LVIRGVSGIVTPARTREGKSLLVAAMVGNGSQAKYHVGMLGYGWCRGCKMTSMLLLKPDTLEAKLGRWRKSK